MLYVMLFYIYFFIADDRVCQPCKQADTYEGILDSICKTQFGKFRNNYFVSSVYSRILQIQLPGLFKYRPNIIIG